ncbi:hypothetical protein [Acinetobacter ursingii]|uniref:hypothetical protein n=1 Tax=Acinetobacter ursingii TaxID=108980 RepID=UPI0012505126|nr:hypothetical protein [Acinetobacter ursingii]
MKKVLLSLVIGLSLAGCSNSKTEKLVKEQLRDPESAQFQNVKNGCGEVNAKNSYGGYTGFKKFYTKDNQVIIDSNDDDILPFYLNWSALCKIPSNLSELEKDECVSESNLAAAAYGAKQSGVTLHEMRDSVRSTSDSDRVLRKSLYVVDVTYVSKFQSREMHALDYLNKCLSGKTKLSE